MRDHSRLRDEAGVGGFVIAGEFSRSSSRACARRPARAVAGKRAAAGSLATSEPILAERDFVDLSSTTPRVVAGMETWASRAC